MKAWAFVVLLTVASWAAEARATETIWSGLVIADNVAQPEPVPAELRPLEHKLRQLFGYNQFQIIGETTKTLVSGEEDCLAWSRYFTLQVDARGQKGAGYILDLKLWKQRELLLETQAKLSRRSPLVVKGPQVGSGQLLLVLLVLQ